MSKLGVFGGVGLVGGIALIILFFVIGTRECGNVYRSIPDKAAAIKNGDTVPAIEQDGDTTLYRYECVAGAGGGNKIFLVAGAALLIAGFLVMRKAKAPATTAKRFLLAPLFMQGTTAADGCDGMIECYPVELTVFVVLLIAGVLGFRWARKRAADKKAGRR